MNRLPLSPEQELKLREMGPALHDLLQAELTAGNAVAALGHGHPAAPCGAWVLLRNRVSTRLRQPDDRIEFHDRNRDWYSGEFTDSKRHFFILEPPVPLSPALPPVPPPSAPVGPRAARERPTASRNAPPSAFERFRRSMSIDYEKWHDGVGYDLDAIGEADAEERRAIEALLCSRPVQDWRDVEALATLDSDSARALLCSTLEGHSGWDLALAVLDCAPHLADDARRTATLVAALAGEEFYGGLTRALRQVETFHPPPVIEALLRGVVHRNGPEAVHFVAMLLYLHGKASSSFDTEQRPYFLSFNVAEAGQRRRLFVDLCSRLAIDHAPYLK